MNSLKTMTLVAIMAAVGYGVYTSLHKRPPADPPAALPDNWTAGPEVQLPAMDAAAPPVALTPGTAAAPPSVQASVPTADPNASMPPPVAPGPAVAAPLSAPGAAPTNIVPTAAEAALGGNPPLPATSLGGEGVAIANDLGTAPTPTTPATPTGDIHAQFAQAFDAAQLAADSGKLADAHLQLSQWYDHPELSEGETRQLVEMLDRLAGTVIYSHKHHLLGQPYEVKAGETLEQISQQYQVPWQLLAKINGIDDPASVRPGQALKVVRGPFHAVVDARNYRLTLFLDGRYAGRFPIGLGRDLPVGDGDFEVQGVYANPIYRGPDMVVQPGDPNNPLGRVWIDLGNQLGIHGTNDPGDVGVNTGRGCILLKPDDIAHVQDILTVGSRVLIRR